MFFILLWWMAGFAALGQEGLPGQGRVPDQERVQVQVATGYEVSGLRWSIAGNSAGRNPNVYSELKWRSVSGVAAGVDLSWNLWRKWVVFGEGRRVFTVSGRVSDTDYGGDNRTNPVYGMGFDSHKGYAYAGVFGVGYRLWTEGRFRLTPVVGYGWSGQRLSIEEDGSLLNSYYRTWWKGLVVRVLGEWRVGQRWGLSLKGGYHQVNYRADADWNLIQAFSHPVSFRHWGDGFGVDGKVGMGYVVGPHATLLLAGDYFNWRTGKGIDELYLVSGQVSQTQLNEVVLSGFGVRAGVRLGW